MLALTPAVASPLDAHTIFKATESRYSALSKCVTSHIELHAVNTCERADAIVTAAYGKCASERSAYIDALKDAGLPSELADDYEADDLLHKVKLFSPTVHEARLKINKTCPQGAPG